MEKDYGSDPLGDGMYRMVPSGDIVDKRERNKRLPLRVGHINDCLGMTWDSIEYKQGGKLNRKLNPHNQKETNESNA